MRQLAATGLSLNMVKGLNVITVTLIPCDFIYVHFGTADFPRSTHKSYTSTHNIYLQVTEIGSYHTKQTPIDDMTFHN